jgi:pyruvate kinase
MATPLQLKKRSRTKIVATVGPACRSPEMLAELVTAGVDVFRLNMAHADLAEHTDSLERIRQISRELRQPIAVLADLAGPKIRLGELPGDLLECESGAEFRFIRGDVSQHAHDLVTTYEPLVDELNVGDSVMLADGTVGMKVLEKGPSFARCKVTQPGPIRSRQGLNLPGVKLSAPAMSEDDRLNAVWAAENQIDFVGLSFVRESKDVRDLKELLRTKGSAARVIAKIEKPEALEHLESIIEAADAIMVARGDLGVEINVAEMPVVQKRIVAACTQQQKPVIIATQMLDSMQHSRRPTRAEVTDVANAILDGGDACMLSGETAIGKYPREAVKMMDEIALATEELFRDNPPRDSGEFHAEGLHAITAAVAYGAGHMAADLDAKLVAVVSHSGATALALSKQRNYVPTVGISDSPRTLRQMCLYWGVIPLADVVADNNTSALAAVTRWGREASVLVAGDYVVLVAGLGLHVGSHNQVIVHQVE